MKISQAAAQLAKPPAKQSDDSIITSLTRAKEKLSAQIRKLNLDQTMDKAEKQSKLKKLKVQVEELELQIQKRQMEKLAEDKRNAIAEASESSDSHKTEEEEQKDADVAMSKGLISASEGKEHLEHLSSVRSRLIAEDGEISERVKRTERMMSEQTTEIYKSLEESRKAVRAYTQSGKETEERNAETSENGLNEQAEAKLTNDINQANVKTEPQESDNRQSEKRARRKKAEQRVDITL